MQIQMTTHARSRVQQRGIPEPVIEGLLSFGRTVHDHHGSEVLYFDHQARSVLRKTWGSETYKRLEAKLDAYAVLSADGSVITVGHRTKRIVRH